MKDELFSIHTQMLATYSRQIITGAKASDQRVGQWLFNKLPDGPAQAVRGSSFDPFYKDLSEQEIYEWLDNHLIFDGYHIVGVFNGDRILWEGQGPNYAADHIRVDLPPTTPMSEVR